ncbi:hypothetical protein HZS_4510 [Henneguya salminicola]|nr:hypothetical protein HZS_4510 [Henneguya salminicola]
MPNHNANKQRWLFNFKQCNCPSHAPTPEDESKRRIISDVRIRARTTIEPPRKLLPDCLSRKIQSVSPSIPSYNSLQRNVQMIRQRIIFPLTIPSDQHTL